MPDGPIKRALIAVYDKTGLIEFARTLVEEFGIEIISTGGTAKHLREADIPVTLVEAVTGFPEMLDGRVKTLHPKIHAAILADRDNPDHMRQLAEQGIEPIDMVVVNLYPFERTVSDPNCTPEQAIEMIDIGGPCLLRAAAKNHQHVLVVGTQDQYGEVLSWIRNGMPEIAGDSPRLRWAANTYLATSRYDAIVSEWISERLSISTAWPSFASLFATNWGKLRYGENPHQKSDLWQIHPADPETGEMDLTIADEAFRDSQPPLSHNNFLDADAALALCAELARASSVWHRPPASPVWHRSPASSVWHRLIAGVEPSSRLALISDATITNRNLPHLQRPGATYFVTFRLKSGQMSETERDIAMECCLYPDGKKACIHAVTIMPDHVHMIFTPLEYSPDSYYSLGKILHGVKGVSGRRIADLRGTHGPIWMDESWDRILRNEADFLSRMEYVRQNPVTAGLGERYDWVVHEAAPGWHREKDSAGVDLAHDLVMNTPIADSGLRPWHRLLAGATQRDKNETHRYKNAINSGQESTSSSEYFARSTSVGRPSAGVCVFIKHTNACGVGIADDPLEAYRRAYFGDPNAAMGGILACNFEVDASFAAVVMETYDRFGQPLKEAGHAAAPGGFFVEVWVAPRFSEAAVKIIRGTAEPSPDVKKPPRKRWGEKVRLLAVGDMITAPDAAGRDYRRIAGGLLVQSRDRVGLNEDEWNIVTKRAPDEMEMADLRLAWLVCKHTKSNAITLCKDGMLIGNGAGQMSRVMSCRIATWLAKENGHDTRLSGAVAASDAFFPFSDGPRILIEAGITAIIQPGGSKRDEEVIAACDERGVAMIFTGTRHFKH